MPTFTKDTTCTEAAKALASEIKGKTVIVTGVSPGGYGAEVALAIARHGGIVILAGRDLTKVHATAEKIRAETPAAQLRELKLDLASIKGVRAAAKEVLAYPGAVDVLILNAGVMGTPYGKTEDGLETQFGTNHIGNFLFTNLITPKLAPGARIVSVASVGHHWGPVRFDDPGFEDGKAYDKWAAYGQSKTANILFAVELAARGRNAVSIHPGGAWTPLFQHMEKADFERFGDYFNADGTPKGDGWRTPEQCSSTHIVAAFDPALAAHNGAYLTDCAVANEQAAPYALDKENAKKLWALSEQIVGEKFA